jgi:hypothetical protein
VKKILLLLTLFISADCLAVTQLRCDGEMTLGGDGVDIGSGINITLDTDSEPKTLKIMGKTYSVETTDASYKYTPQTSTDDALTFDRYTLSLVWVNPKGYEHGAMVFKGNCEILGEPKI